jgi:hypothetical protein
LWCDVQRMLNCITTNDAQHFMRHCGYRYRSE